MSEQFPRIGIAPQAPTKAELEQDMPRCRLVVQGTTGGKALDSASSLVIPGETKAPAFAPALVLPPSADPDPELTWPEYVAWRKTKCPPVDDLARATLELVGEAAELAELILHNGPAVFYDDLRVKLIDECGDIFFCANWALDSWGKNPFADADDLEMVRVEEDNPLLMFTGALATNTLLNVQHSPTFVQKLGQILSNAITSIQTQVGLTSNATKKQVYQGRQQDIDKQVGLIVAALLSVNQILIIANSNVEEALTANRTKLDARYPMGWHANVGGGIREGAGA